jgi:serine/threonine protein kinase
MPSIPTPPRLGPRVPLPPPPREGAALIPPDDSAYEGLRAGDLLEGRYQVEDKIGEGGIGVVYRAVQLKLHRRVAVKLLMHETMGEEDLRARFEREAVALAALSHPNIVSLTDYGIARGRPFLVMELLEGKTLRELVDEQGAMSVERALNLTRQLVHGVAYAHARGIVHRDLKPANLIVQTLPNQPEHLKILDFGLVKFLPGSRLDPGVQLSRVGFTFGTPAYMSPEHASGSAVDGRSDLYSIGILMFEMLTGTKPFDGELDEVLRAHFSAPVPALGDRVKELKGRLDLDMLLRRALAKQREDRFADAAEMLAALEAIAPSEGGAAPSTPAPTGSGLVRANATAPLAVPGMRDSLSVKARRFGDGVMHFLRTFGSRVMYYSHEAKERSWSFSQPRLVRLAERIAQRALAAKNRLENMPPREAELADWEDAPTRVQDDDDAPTRQDPDL